MVGRRPRRHSREKQLEDNEVRTCALDALRIRAPHQKTAAVERLQEAARRGELTIDRAASIDAPPDLPGRPEQPELVPPGRVAQRSVATERGRAALLHALAHIEFNAVNLALDAVWRFAGMPATYYTDWLGVAAEEATHFGLLCARLRDLGCAYGDFAAHDGLWQLAQRTSGDVLARMALVPRTMEARGLDASPQVRAKFAGAGDNASASIIDTILRDEIGHVAIGNRWFGFLCARDGADPLATYAQLATQYGAPRLRGPFNLEARRAAGFSEAELAALDR